MFESPRQSLGICFFYIFYKGVKGSTGNLFTEGEILKMRDLKSPITKAAGVSINFATENCLSAAKTCYSIQKCCAKCEASRFFSLNCGCVDSGRKKQQQQKQKKKVRFADEHGGKLCNVKVFECKLFSIPKLRINNRSMTNYTVVYNEAKVNAENICTVAYGILANSNIFGAIAVRNLAYDKEVFVRITLDLWKTSKDIHASFVQQERNETVDRFFFMNPLEDYEFSEITTSLEFAVCYCVDGRMFWDNNNGKNYTFR